MYTIYVKMFLRGKNFIKWAYKTDVDLYTSASLLHVRRSQLHTKYFRIAHVIIWR